MFTHCRFALQYHGQYRNTERIQSESYSVLPNVFMVALTVEEYFCPAIMFSDQMRQGHMHHNLYHIIGIQIQHLHLSVLLSNTHSLWTLIGETD